MYEICISVEILKFWYNMTLPIHCLLLVTHISRFDEYDVQMVDFICESLLEDSRLKENILLVITKSDDSLINDESKVEEWLAEELKNTTPFSKFFELVNKDPKRVLFVNNWDTEKSTSVDKKRKNAKHNIQMAYKVISAIHDNINGDSVSPVAFVKNAKARREELTKKIKKETVPEKKSQLSKCGIAVCFTTCR